MMTLAAGVVPTQPYSPDSLLASHTDTPSYAKAAFARQRCNEGLILATGRGDTSPKHKRLAVPRLRFGLVSPRPVTGNQAPQHWMLARASRRRRWRPKATRPRTCLQGRVASFPRHAGL